MACDITSGFTLGCRDNSGGIKNLYILSGSVDTIGEASEGLINGLSGSGTFYKFELFRQTSDYTETLTATPENGTLSYEQSVNAVFFKLQSSTRNQVRVLAKNPDLKVIVETNNGSDDGVGKFFYLGEANGLQLTGATAGTGTSFNDLNGYTMNFVGVEPEPASEVSGSTLTDILSGISVG
jgi:hypothetical protein